MCGDVNQAGSSQVYLGVSGKPECLDLLGLKPWSGWSLFLPPGRFYLSNLLNMGIGPCPFWHSGKCMMATFLGFYRVLRMNRIYYIFDSLSLCKQWSPLFIHCPMYMGGSKCIAAISININFPSLSQFEVLCSSALWAKVTVGFGWAHTFSKVVTWWSLFILHKAVPVSKPGSLHIGVPWECPSDQVINCVPVPKFWSSQTRTPPGLGHIVRWLRSGLWPLETFWQSRVTESDSGSF